MLPNSFEDMPHEILKPKKMHFSRFLPKTFSLPYKTCFYHLMSYMARKLLTSKKFLPLGILYLKGMKLILNTALAFVLHGGTTFWDWSYSSSYFFTKNTILSKHNKCAQSTDAHNPWLLRTTSLGGLTLDVETTAQNTQFLRPKNWETFTLRPK